MICKICPHSCDLQENETGICGVRYNRDNNSVLKYYGNVSNISIDQIEKRPLFHFFPGAKCLSVGFYGCQLSCKFCFNYKISQQILDNKTKTAPLELVDKAIENDANIIVFSFNEPSLYYEYIIDVANISKKHGIKIVIKSNGYINEHVLDLLIDNVDAFNIDIKGDEVEYKNTCGGTLSTVLNSIKRIFNKTHLEVSNLILPRLVDNYDYHDSVISFISSLSKDVPVHLINYYPFYKMNEQGYLSYKLINIIKHFKKTLKYVYLSNLYDKNYINYRNTLCQMCGDLMIERTNGVKILKNRCCSEKIKGIYKK